MFTLPADAAPLYVVGVVFVLTVLFVVCAAAELRGYRSARRDVPPANRSLPIDDGPLDPPYSFASDTLDSVRDRIR